MSKELTRRLDPEQLVHGSLQTGKQMCLGLSLVGPELVLLRKPGLYVKLRKLMVDVGQAPTLVTCVRSVLLSQRLDIGESSATASPRL
jgi:hypothetical protein